ncbi:MAG: SCP2 sterol-binding domain-containing protein [Deltaproteobacteria bacterium]|nr:SCP2 sterol-binding domain-containing protein [Deltaproteobacteria bacterium]
MAIFPSKEWADDVYSKINASEEYAKTAADWEKSVTLIIEAEKGKLDNSFILWLDPWHGKVRSYEILKSIEDKQSDFIITSTYSTWKEIVKGEKNPTKLLLERKLKVKGSMTYLLRRTKTNDALMNVLKSVKSEFADEG